jgi:DNA mismatch endonuclease (patch repair protein)
MYGAIIQVQGCFWHLHACRYFKWPKTQPEFWRNKIEKNVVRDQAALYQLKTSGWRVFVVWECALKGVAGMSTEILLDHFEDWLRSRSDYLELPEIPPHA